MVEHETLIDCVVIALVRSSFQVKLNSTTIFVSPYSPQYGRGFCTVVVESGKVEIRGEVRFSHGGYGQGTIFSVGLDEPRCFDLLTLELQKYFAR